MNKYLLNHQEYLIVSSMPTPNGELHLGHISGPFLTMDVLKRRINRDQGRAKLVSGSDVYESHVLLKAHQEGCKTENVCNKYHELIKGNLEQMNLSFDTYINPLDPEHLEPYVAFIKKEFENLKQSEVLIEKEEEFYKSQKYQDIISGCWIKGECPGCGNPTGNYQCENCFSFYNPQDLGNVISNREGDEDLKKIVSKSSFVKINQEKLTAILENSNLSKAQMDIISIFFKTHNSLIRVTSPESWGVPVLDEINNDVPQMSFPYVSMLFYAIYCAGLINKQNPFDKDSKAIIINAHGMDNLVPTSAGMIGLGLELENYKSFDHHMANYFLKLDGDKFSTSRNNAIWVREIIEEDKIESDYVRYYLTKNAPQFGEVNITKSELLQKAEEVKTRFSKSVGNAITVIAENEQAAIVDDQVYNTFLSYLEEEQKALSPSTFHVAETVEVMEKWFDFKYEIEKDNMRWWLLCFSVFLCPVMPNLSKKIWNEVLKNKEEVSLEYLFNMMEEKRLTIDQMNPVEIS